MKALQIALSFFTAFAITAGGGLVVVSGSGNHINASAVTIACITGLVAGAKDLRSLLRLPPVNGENKPTRKDP